MSHPVVTRAAWLEAREALLVQEKELSKARDAIAAARRALPWVEVTEDYRFSDADGEHTLAELFEGRSQLIVYHFMFGADWEAGCKSCSFLTDHYQGALEHLHARDVSLVAVSIGPLEKLHAYRARMGWRHRWVSSAGSRFNYDYGVSFTPEDIAAGATYNYGGKAWGEAPGLSVFIREGGRIFHTYSTYSRGLDSLINAYNLLDLVPKGRDEAGLEFSMGWVKRHDEY
jgi:predicted dithiol-disulfide oxidoreductase (DUF899 family)